MIVVPVLTFTVMADQLDRSRCKRHSRCSRDIPGICPGLTMVMPKYAANCVAGSGTVASKPRRWRCSIASCSAHVLKPRCIATPVLVVVFPASLGQQLHTPIESWYSMLLLYGDQVYDQLLSVRQSFPAC